MYRRGFPPSLVGLAALVLLLGDQKRFTRRGARRPGGAGGGASRPRTAGSEGGDRRHRPSRPGPVWSLALGGPTARSGCSCLRRRHPGHLALDILLAGPDRFSPDRPLYGGERRHVAGGGAVRRTISSGVCTRDSSAGQNLPATPIPGPWACVAAGPLAVGWRGRPVATLAAAARLRRAGGGCRHRRTDPPRSIAGHGRRRSSGRASRSRRPACTGGRGAADRSRWNPPCRRLVAATWRDATCDCSRRRPANGPWTPSGW